MYGSSLAANVIWLYAGWAKYHKTFNLHTRLLKARKLGLNANPTCVKPMLAVRFIMNFQQALTVLGIEDYAERIFASNSHGELLHLQQYFTLAETFKDDAKWFRDWFIAVVEFAEQNWQRPESVFQHISKILVEQMSKK